MDVSALIANLQSISKYYEEKGKANTQLQLNQVIAGLTDLSVKNSELTSENLRLKVKLKRARTFIEAKGVIWKKSDKQFSQPYCPVCYESGKNIPLQKCWTGARNNQTPWACPDKTCGATFNPWDYEEPDDTGIVTSGHGQLFNLDDRY